jgi:hypothetical protein
MANAVDYTQSPFNLSRKDKFLLVLNVPPALRNINSQFADSSDSNINLNLLQFAVHGSVIPEIKVPSASVRYSGQTLAQTSYSREPYTPLTVKFTVDNRFTNYWVIYKWLNLLNNDKTSLFDKDELTQSPTTYQNASFNQYKTIISIFALDEYNTRIMEFKYTDAFPTNLAGIDYNYRDAGGLESSFTFEYSQFIATPTGWAESL